MEKKWENIDLNEELTNAICSYHIDQDHDSKFDIRYVKDCPICGKIIDYWFRMLMEHIKNNKIDIKIVDSK